MKHLFRASLVLVALALFQLAHAQQLINCVSSSSTQCNPTTNPGSGSQGDPAWKAYGKTNTNFETVWGMLDLSLSPSNGQLLIGSGGVYIPAALTAGAGVSITNGAGSITIASTGGGSMTWPSSAGIPCYSSSAWCTSYNAGNPIPGTYLNLSTATGLPVSGLTSFAADNLLCGNGSSSPALVAPSATSGYPLISQGSSACPAFGQLPVNAISASGTASASTYLRGDGSWATPTGSGTVTNFSFTPANGFSGSVTNPTTTPILSLSITSPLQLSGSATSGLGTCNSASKGQITYTTDGTAAFTFCNGVNWVNSGRTPLTYVATGCTPSASSLDATGGSITLAAGPCTSIVLTFNGAVGMTAPHGVWDCDVNDETLQNAGTWFGRWGQSAHTSTTATIPIPPAAGATDTITFTCTSH